MNKFSNHLLGGFDNFILYLHYDYAFKAVQIKIYENFILVFFNKWALLKNKHNNLNVIFGDKNYEKCIKKLDEVKNQKFSSKNGKKHIVI